MLIVRLLAISVADCMSTEDESPSNANEAVFPAISVTLSVNETATRTDNVTADRAKEIAFTHAGLTKAEVTFVKAKLDTDDSRQEYC